MMQYDGVIMASFSDNCEFDIKNVHKIIGEITVKDKAYLLIGREIINPDEEATKNESV